MINDFGIGFTWITFCPNKHRLIHEILFDRPMSGSLQCPRCLELLDTTEVVNHIVAPATKGKFILGLSDVIEVGGIPTPISDASKEL